MTTDIFNMTDTWTDSGTTYTALKMNVTNTASASGSRIFDFQLAGVSQGMMRRDGNSVWQSLAPRDGEVEIFRSTTEAMARTLAGRAILLIPGDGNPKIALQEAGQIGFTASAANTDVGTSTDAVIIRQASGVVGIRGTSLSTGGALGFLEQTAPSAPSANQVVMYAEDNGSGKTRLMARFPTGAAQQVAIEP